MERACTPFDSEGRRVGALEGMEWPRNEVKRTLKSWSGAICAYSYIGRKMAHWGVGLSGLDKLR